MKKVLIVFGTRPEAIKMAPVVKACEQHAYEMETKVCITGQHKEMLQQVLKVFDITPDYDLSVMHKGQDLYDITSRVLVGMRDVLKECNPDLVLVHGDTTTSVAAALAAFYQQIPVGHVEAGLRTYDKYSPWPEEINRQLTSRLATFHFAPTALSKKNLLNEGIKEESVLITGNTVIDALKIVLDRIDHDGDVNVSVRQSLKLEGISEELINRWGHDRRLVLITGHRRENFGEGFLSICSAIKELAIKYPEVDFVYPVHLNPHVIKPVYDLLGKHESDKGESDMPNVYLIKPLDYLPFVYLMGKSYFILTDSGGVQEEAPGLGKPVLVMRNTTERPEAVEAGTVRLTGTDRDKIVSESCALLENPKIYKAMSDAHNPYGDGLASGRIIKSIRAYFLQSEPEIVVQGK